MTDTTAQIEKRLPTIGRETKRVNMRCPHCHKRWYPKRSKKVKWCPHCHRDITVEKPRQTQRVEDVRILGADRFTPGRMHTLCELRLYKYMGIPRSLPSLPQGRERQRRINLRMADRFFQSKMTGVEIANELGITRQAFYLRMEKVFNLMVERGSFQLTQKGKEKIAREKIEMAKTYRKGSVKPSASAGSGAV